MRFRAEAVNAPVSVGTTRSTQPLKYFPFLLFLQGRGEKQRKESFNGDITAMAANGNLSGDNNVSSLTRQCCALPDLLRTQKFTEVIYDTEVKKCNKVCHYRLVRCGSSSKRIIVTHAIHFSTQYLLLA